MTSDDLTRLAARIATLERTVSQLMRTSRLAYSSIEDGAVDVYDRDGSLRAIVGQLPDGTSGITVVNGPPPPTPSAPEVTAALAALDIHWNGGFADALGAPLDFTRVEVHIGPAADFPLSQGTLRDTIETAQGGSVTVPLPYTQWWVRLRARTAAGVAGPPSTSVEGTPRRAAAADLQAGAVTADSIAADALTGKTITGGTISGAVVTGGRLQTADDGNRVEVAPDGDIGGVVRLYSGSEAETRPGELAAGVVTWKEINQPYLRLSAPRYRFDTAELQLISPVRDQVGGSFSLDADDPTTGYGGAYVHGGAAGTIDGTSFVELYAHDGPAAGGRSSSLHLTGQQVRVRSGASTYQFAQSSAHLPADVTISGTLRAGSIATGRVTITPVAADTPTPATVTGLSVAGSSHHALATSISAVPGLRVTGVSASDISRSGLTIWLTRTNTNTTGVNWILIGSPGSANTASAAVLSAEETPEPWAPTNAVATCHTAGCPAADVVFRVTLYKDAGGVLSACICGSCGRDVADLEVTAR